MGIARRVAARLVAALSAPRGRSATLLGALVACVAAAAWSATPACACGGGSGYDIYDPFLNLPDVVDFDGEGGGMEGASLGPHGFTFSFLAPFILADSADPARHDEFDDLSAVYDHRSDWVGALPLGDTTRPRLSDTAFVRALRAGALDRAAVQARALVDRSLDMPAGIAQLEQPVIQRAVEFLELRPQLGGVDGRILARFFAAPPVPRDTPAVSSRYDSAEVTAARVRAWRRAQVARMPDPVPDESLPPVLRGAAVLRRLSRADLAAQAGVITQSLRLPSLRFVALQERTHAFMAEGWGAWDTVHVDRARRRALRADYDAWLAAYPTHPLAELVRLYTVRADRLVGDSAGPWRTLLAMYPRHRARVVAEMYALLVAGEDPPPTIRAAITDPLLRSALVFRTFGCENYNCSEGDAPRYDRATWNAEWRRAQAARPAAWAVNAEERLLRVALADTSRAPLPAAFPTAAEAPTPLWGAMRLAILIQARRWEDADAQAALLAPGRLTAALRLRIAMRRRQWSRALGDSALHPDTRRYLLQVMAPDSVLAAIVAAPDRGVRDEAVRTQAARLAGAQRWRDAARLVKATDDSLARRLDSAAALSADRSSAGRAAFAQFLVEAQGELLGGADEREWYRTVEQQWGAAAGDTAFHSVVARRAGLDVPWTAAQERDAARHFLRTNSELYFALGAYGDALRALPGATPAGPRRALARAADVPYNRLINRDYKYTVFWPQELARDSNVAAIRRAGRR